MYEDGTIVYLSQEDSFEFELSLGDVLDEITSVHHEPGDVLGYWEGELKRIPNNRFVNAQAVLSQIESAACDEIAEECIDDFLSCVECQEAMEELSSLLDSCCGPVVTSTRWMCWWRRVRCWPPSCGRCRGSIRGDGCGAGDDVLS